MQVRCRVVFIPVTKAQSYERDEWLQTAFPGKIVGSAPAKAVVPIFILDGKLHDQYPWMMVKGNTGWYAAADGFARNSILQTRRIDGHANRASPYFHVSRVYCAPDGQGHRKRNSSEPLHRFSTLSWSLHFRRTSGQSRCMNAFIDRGYANYLNAKPYFAAFSRGNQPVLQRRTPPIHYGGPHCDAARVRQGRRADRT